MTNMARVWSVCESHADSQELYDMAEDYAEPGYRKDHAAGVIVFGNWNPKRFPREGDAPLTREENAGPRLAAALEWMGCDLQWCDEWTVCGECRRAMRTQPDSYSWQMFGAFVEDACEYICADCLKEDMTTSLEPYINSTQTAVLWATSADMIGAGWTQWEPGNEQSYESGWHPGQDDKPETIMENIRRETEADVVFLIDGVGQFDIRFSAWARDENDDES